MSKAYWLAETASEKTPADLVSRLQQTWCRHGELELHRLRSRLRSLDQQQQATVSDVLQGLVDAVLFPVAQYVRTMPPDKEASAVQALALLFGADLKEAHGPQT